MEVDDGEGEVEGHLDTQMPQDDTSIDLVRRLLKFNCSPVMTFIVVGFFSCRIQS